MSRQDIHSSDWRHARYRRAITIGVAVPAVVSMGALPAFAAHSADLDEGLDEGEDGDVESLEDEFAEAEELEYDPFEDADEDPDGDSGEADTTAQDDSGETDDSDDTDSTTRDG